VAETAAADPALFTPKKVASYATIIAEETSALLDRWPTEPGGFVDAHAEMAHLALRVVGRAVFGDDLDEAEPVLRWAFPVVTRQTFRRAMSPLPKSLPTPGNSGWVKARAALYGVVDELITRRRRAGSDGDDLLSRPMRARSRDG
jgi:cytochrome P450